MLIFLLVAALSPLRVTILAPQIVALAEALSGQRLEVNGDVWVTLRQFATIRLTDLATKAPDNSPLMEIGELSATLNPWALVMRHLEGEISVRQLAAGFLTVEQASAHLASGQPLQLNGKGRVTELTGALELRTAPLEAFLEPEFTVPVEIALKLADANLALSAAITLPHSTSTQRMAIAIQGSSLDAFRTLIRNRTLPNIGPYALRGTARISQEVFSIDELDVTVGESDLHGSFVYEPSTPRPRFDLSLRSKMLQLDDFLVLPRAENRANVISPDNTEQRKFGDKDWVGNVLFGEYAPALRFLADLDGNLAVEVGELRSGRDVMGGGKLGVSFKDRKLSVNPLKVALPGGGIEMSIGFDATDAKKLHATWTADIRRFDFGVLARRLEPATNYGGLISLRAKLDMQHSVPEDLLAGANGYLDIGVWPKNIGSGLIDLWAINLLNALATEVDPRKDKSRINCVIARTKIKDGLLVDDVLFIDTSHIIAGAEIAVDFKKKAFEVYAVPESKTPQLFAAKTPIRAAGTFDKFDVGPAPGGILQTAFRIIVSPITYPFELLFADRFSADGEPQCSLGFTSSVADLRAKATSTKKKPK